MPLAPSTRHSLIIRLRNRADAEAWTEFVRLYEPVIYNVAVRRGLQHADAVELVQHVLLAVARAIDRFQPDPDRCRFRTWLHTITHHEFCKEYARRGQRGITVDSAVWNQLIHARADVEDDFQAEYRRGVFRWAAARVEPTCKPSTWQAFWRTTIDDLPVERAAEELGLSVGAVYIARSRVMARLRTEVTRYVEDDDGV